MSTAKSSRITRTIATLLLMLALLLIGFINYARYQSSQILGPEILLPVSENQLWVLLKNEIWIIDATGQRTAVKTAEQFGMQPPFSAAALTHDGQVLLGSRKSPEMALIDPNSLTRQGSITLRWPEGFEKRYTQAFFMATAPGGDIAIATGGGHTVLLFDSNGNFKAKTPCGSYDFTNGLWHSPQGWWTTDTNSSMLKLLDSDTLDTIKSIKIKQAKGYRFLGQMRPSEGINAPTAKTVPPLATVARSRGKMRDGHVSDMFPGGAYRDYTSEPVVRLMDFAWFNQQLLVLDGENIQIQRYTPSRTKLADFGDAALQAQLKDIWQARAFWRSISSDIWLLAAIALLVLGVFFYLRSKALKNVEKFRDETFQLGTPMLENKELMRLSWLFFRRVMLIPVVIMLFLFATLKLSLSGTINPESIPLLIKIFTISILFTILFASIYVYRRHHALMADPQFEGLLNRLGVLWLTESGEWNNVRQPQEMPLESTVFRRGLQSCWLLITNQRILLFRATSLERRLFKQWPRSALVKTGASHRHNLILLLNDQQIWRGQCPSSATARRIIELLAKPLTSQSSSPAAGLQAQNSASVSAPAKWHQRPLAQCIASVIYPGVGHFMQNRFATGLAIFILSTFLLILVIGLMGFVSFTPKTAVSSLSWISNLILWLLLAVYACLDVWRFSQDQNASARPPHQPVR